MSHTLTINVLFDLAIRLERAAEAVYQELAARFTHAPEVARFWQEYAAEEAGHARWLARIQQESSPERLAQQADATMVEEARRLLEVPVEQHLKRVQDLEDVYQLVSEMESSETNAIFEFLLESFSGPAKTHTFIRTQLRSHIGKLMTEFPEGYRDKASRLRLKAHGPGDRPPRS